MFKKYYKIKNDYEAIVYYRKGISANFPDFTLLIDYSADLHFYFIMLVYEVEDIIAVKQ